SATGSWQNLGYVLQWPLFGVFPAFMFWRLRKLRAQQRADVATPADQPRTATPLATTPRTATPLATTPRTATPLAATPLATMSAFAEPAPARPRPTRQDEDDPELAAYNRYLAQLNAMDQETR
ncbi:MAG: transcriptional regulator, partial [Actinophytocola sp.]|uniref:transcriptional regulator n=1 Tax=Actinophytocola sp. TaxID=1872138 RepID=UPI00132C0982